MEAHFRLTDPGSRPGQKKKLEMLIDGEWADISGGLRAARGGEHYTLRWTDHCWKYAAYDPPPFEPLVTYFDKDGDVIEPV